MVKNALTQKVWKGVKLSTFFKAFSFNDLSASPYQLFIPREKCLLFIARLRNTSLICKHKKTRIIYLICILIFFIISSHKKIHPEITKPIPHREKPENENMICIVRVFICNYNNLKGLFSVILVLVCIRKTSIWMNVTINSQQS